MPTLIRRWRWLQTCALFVVVAVAGAIAWSSSASADDWLPISPEELKMTSDPKAPGALAVNLYRQVDRDDQANRETNYASRY